MKAVVLTCYESNEERMKLVIKSLELEGFEVVSYTSNFSHIRKEYRNNIPEGMIALNAFSYKKNLSVSRLYSHNKFAKDVYLSICEDSQADDFDYLKKLEEIADEKIPASLRELENMEIRHDNNVTKDNAKDFIIRKAESL